MEGTTVEHGLRRHGETARGWAGTLTGPTVAANLGFGSVAATTPHVR